jgi:hypothetical protein
MAHYAKIDKNNIVTRVLVIDEETVNSGEFGNPLNWIQTSYNTYGGQHSLGGTPLRKNYAGVGMTYDKTRDAFIPAQPYPSWILDEDTCQWYSPVSYPLPEEKEAFSGSVDHIYEWDEDNVTWKVSVG